MITIIAAIEKNGGIGLKNNLPWEKIPEDMNHFRNHTKGHPVIMGFGTFNSLGSKPLPSRCNIVISSQHDDEEAAKPHCIGNTSTSVALVNSLEKALEVAREVSEKDVNNDVFIIGGAVVYKQALPLTDRLLITRINGEYECDTFWNPDVSNWHFVKSTEIKREDKLICTFEEYRRK